MPNTVGDGSASVRTLETAGIALEVPDGWEARIRLHPSQGEDGTVRPVMHAATVPLIADRGDYGSGVVELLGSDDVFVGLIEFDEEAANTELFEEVDVFPSVVDPSSLHPRQLQRVIPGQGGVQRFFTYRGRPFCLYVVVGSFPRRVALAESASSLMASLRIADHPS